MWVTDAFSTAPRVRVSGRDILRSASLLYALPAKLHTRVNEGIQWPRSRSNAQPVLRWCSFR